MIDERCDFINPINIKQKKMLEIGGLTVKFHANGTTIWSKGKMMANEPDGYWEWYRINGTLKRSGYFDKGKPVGEWTTYDENGKKYKTTYKK